MEEKNKYLPGNQEINSDDSFNYRIVDDAQKKLIEKSFVENEFKIFNSFNEKEALKNIQTRISTDNSSAGRKGISKTLFAVISIAAAIILVFILKDFVSYTNKTDNSISANNSVIVSTENGDRQVVDDSKKVIQLGNITLENNSQVGKLAQSSINKKAKPTLITVEVPYGKTYKIELPDGTIVKLNSKSSLSYYSSFPGNTRVVTLSGEAYFEVVKDNNKPFIVKESKGEVTVLGTRFNIKDYSDDNLSKITLIDGSVSVSKLASSVVLTPGKTATLDYSSENIKVEKADILSELAWINDRFEYRDVTLEYIAKDLNRWYGKNFNFETNDLSSMRVTLSVSRTANVERIITIINSYSGLSVTKTDNSSFLIKKK